MKNTPCQHPGKKMTHTRAVAWPQVAAGGGGQQ